MTSKASAGRSYLYDHTTPGACKCRRKKHPCRGNLASVRFLMAFKHHQVVHAYPGAEQQLPSRAAADELLGLPRAIARVQSHRLPGTEAATQSMIHRPRRSDHHAAARPEDTDICCMLLPSASVLGCMSAIRSAPQWHLDVVT